MEVFHRPAQGKGGEHVAIDIEIARKIGIPDAAFIKTAHRTQCPGVLEPDLEARWVSSERLNVTVGEGHQKRYGRVTELAREPAEQRSRELWDRRLGRRRIALQDLRVAVHAPTAL